MKAKSHLTTRWLNFDDPIEAYRGNPLIGSLGRIPTKKQVIDILTHRPDYFESGRKLDSHLRPHAAFAMRQLFIPMATHVSVVQEVDLLLRQGYRHRNPLDMAYRRRIRKDRELLENKILPPQRFARMQLGTSATGTAGTGKTISFEIATSRHPEVVEHSLELEGELIAFKQVPTLTLHMFQDASLKAFGIEFFNRLGQALQEPIRETWRVDSATGNAIQFLLLKACIDYNIGLIVVDELQNMKAHGQDYTIVLAYFTRLMNTLGVPVAVIGTELARTLISADLPSARRFLGNIPPFAPIPKGPMWRQFLKELWRYQYLRTYTTADKFEDLLHDISAGIPDIVVKLYLLIQLRLFGKKSEVITDKIIRQTADLLLHSIKNNLRSEREQKANADGFTTALGEAEESFKEQVNAEAHRVGCEPLYPDVPTPTVEVSPAEPRKDPRTGLAGATNVDEARRMLKQKGQLGL